MKTKNLLFSVVPLLSLIGLSACDETASDSDKKTYCYTVNFFDDSETPKQVGYAYVWEGEKATIKKMDNSDVYDYESHSGKAVAPGTKDVFSSWKGTYDETKLNRKGETIIGEVDLSNIQNDCNVYAHFENEPLSYKVSFKNGSSIYTNYDGATFEWGTFASLPETDPTTDEEWGYDTSLKGYSFGSSTNDLLTKANASKARFLYGEGTPATSDLFDMEGNKAIATPGSLYEDTTNMDFYAYSGSWVRIGNFKSATHPIVTYISNFNHELKQFTVNFYKNSSKAERDLIGSLQLDYASKVHFDNESKTITGISKGEPVSLDFSSYITDYYQYWYGCYSSDLSVPSKYRGQEVGYRQDVPIAADTSFWPIY